MFEFKFTEEQQMPREMVRDFNKWVKTQATKIEQEEKSPMILSKTWELGILGAVFRRNTRRIWRGWYYNTVEEISRACLSTAISLSYQSRVLMPLFSGSEDLNKIRCSACTGSLIGAFALQKHAGSDSFNIKTTAELNGTTYKWW
jgi:alkylation response protein AidB-like acyl-CoA dehydrogenase